LVDKKGERMKKCESCKKKVRRNYPFGKKSRPRERGHKEGCKKGDG